MNEEDGLTPDECRYILDAFRKIEFEDEFYYTDSEWSLIYGIIEKIERSLEN